MSDQFDPRRYTDPSNMSNQPGDIVSVNVPTGTRLSEYGNLPGSVTATQSPTLFGQWPTMPLTGATMATTRPRRFPLGRAPLWKRKRSVAALRHKNAVHKVWG